MTPTTVARLIAEQARARRGDLLIAALCAGATALAATWLLGLSGWFLAAAAAAGAAGPAAVLAFNYLLPSAGVRALAITRTAGRYGERIFGHRAALRALAAIRPALFAGIAASPPGRALALSSGEASARLIQDVDALEIAFVRRPAPWAAAAGAGAAAVAIALASAWAALAFLVGLAIQLVIALRLSGRWSGDPSRRRLQGLGRLKDGLAAYHAAAAELQSFSLTSRAVASLMAHDAQVASAALRRADAEARLDALQLSIAGLTVAGVGGLSLGAPTPLLALAVLSALAGQEGAAALLRAWRDEEGRIEAQRRLDEAICQSAPTARSGLEPPSPAASLKFLGQSFGPGSRIGVTGPSGSGKTSLLETLVGLREPRSDLAYIGGLALEDRPAGWARELFAYAPQDARLLSGTVAENLCLAAADADEAAMWDVLADAQLADRVRRLPHGLQTWLGDGAEIFSGGERRRLSIARALLRPAPWLLLDEPTDGLDRDTEAGLTAALSARLARTGQGLILVSHRPAPLSICQIVLTIGPAGPHPA